MKKPRHVLVALGWYDHRLLEGIAAYASEHRWHLSAHSVLHEREIPWGWEGDGVLAWLASGEDLAEFVLSVRRPTVDFSLRRPHLPFGHVVQDHRKTGGLVAEHLADRGVRRFLYYSDSENWSQVERGAGYAERVQELGFGCEWLRWKGGDEAGPSAKTSWRRRRDWLLAALRSTQKPVGIFAANGALAVEVHETCEGASIPVPDHVAIVGMDDHLQSVGAASRLISGVDPNLEEQGYQGAAMLDRMMRSGRVPARPMRIAPRGVMARRSSDLLAVGHPGVARALRVIGERLGEGIGVEDLARAAGMSVRGLHEAFRESLGCSPGERLRRVRLEEAKRLLRGTGEKLQSIAEQTGFANLNTFFVAFKKAEGMTPAEYRRTSSRGR